jgi:hypothetical protein
MTYGASIQRNADRANAKRHGSQPTLLSNPAPRRNHRTGWTWEQIGQLVIMRRDGYSLPAIAAAIGRTEAAIDDETNRLRRKIRGIPARISLRRRNNLGTKAG